MSYAASVRRKPNAKYRRGPYRKRLPYGMPYPPRSSVPRNRVLSIQGGVPGAAQQIIGAMPVTPEVKYVDTGVSLLTGSGFSLLQNGVLASIRQNALQTGRIGREIRLVGLVYRMVVQSGQGLSSTVSGVTTVNVQASPYAIDFILDSQPQAASPTISGATTSIYDGSNYQSLPNVESKDRYTFVKRLEIKDPNTVYTTQSGVVRMNKVIQYNADTGLATDLQNLNVLISCASAGGGGSVPFQISGVVRYMYVDC